MFNIISIVIYKSYWLKVDAPATWFREKIVEPLHDKHKMPYYHRRLKRIPGIDQCGVSDMVCIHKSLNTFVLHTYFFNF